MRRRNGMRRALVVLAAVLTCAVVVAQRPPRGARPSQRALTAEGAVKQAMEQLGEEKKVLERDLQALAHLRTADKALTDPMQPSVAVQKAFEEVSEAARLNSDPFVGNGLIRVRQALEEARRSPGSADFGRLRSVLRREAIGPSSRLVVTKATALQDETVAWIRVQELIAMHLRTLSELTGESLRASQEE